MKTLGSQTSSPVLLLLGPTPIKDHQKGAGKKCHLQKTDFVFHYSLLFGEREGGGMESMGLRFLGKGSDRYYSF